MEPQPLAAAHMNHWEQEVHHKQRTVESHTTSKVILEDYRQALVWVVDRRQVLEAVRRQVLVAVRRQVWVAGRRQVSAAGRIQVWVEGRIQVWVAGRKQVLAVDCTPAWGVDRMRVWEPHISISALLMNRKNAIQAKQERTGTYLVVHKLVLEVSVVRTN